jgi:hypothetical protein
MAIAPDMPAIVTSHLLVAEDAEVDNVDRGEVGRGEAAGARRPDGPMPCTDSCGL